VKREEGRGKKTLCTLPSLSPHPSSLTPSLRQFPVPRLRHGQPLWLDRSTLAKPQYPRHKGQLDVDVVIIGGGISGAICAYLFSDAGARVALLESNLIARGSTAASSALLMQEPDRDFADLAGRFGRSATIDIWRSLARATRDLTRTIRSLKIDCDLHVRDSVYFTLDPDRLSDLRKEFNARKGAGLPGRWLSPTALYRMTGIRALAGIATSGNAEVDPIRTCRGFLSAAVSSGAHVFERSRALRVKTVRGGVVVRTAGGAITAKVAVIATGYSRPGFAPRVGRFRMKDTYVVATRRLPVRLRRRIAASKVMAWDTDRPYHYLRWTEDGRLLIGGEDTNHRTVRGSRKRIAKARARLCAYLSRIFPVLAEESPAYEWEGLFAETPDGLPYIGTHSRYPRHLFALGYGGNGMTASFLAGQLLLRRYRQMVRKRTGQDAVLDLFAFDRSRR
jgi:glycine/D-amino acid oxidase-like deaminating enzyme